MAAAPSPICTRLTSCPASSAARCGSKKTEPIFGGYLAIYLALDRRLPIIPATRFGDLSYGLYIYGWPIAATIMYVTGGRANWWQVFALTLPLAALLAHLSWRFVEEPLLRLKPRRGPAPVAAPVLVTSAERR